MPAVRQKLHLSSCSEFLKPALYIDTVGQIRTNGYVGRAGIGGATSNIFNINWVGGIAQLWIDTSNVGNIQVSSDQRIKKNIQRLAATSGLDVINALNPVTFNWIDEGAGTSTQYGFIAQQVKEVLPDLVRNTGLISSSTPDGMLHLDYNGLFAPIVKAIQEIASIGDTFRTNLIGWFADATNGIKEFFAASVHTQEICTKKSDGSDVCASGDQLAALLASAGQPPAAPASSPSSGGSSSDPATPPTPAPSTSPEPSDAATPSINSGQASSSDIYTEPVERATKSAPAATEPTTPIANSPPLTPEEEPEPTPTTTIVPDEPAPTSP